MDPPSFNSGITVAPCLQNHPSFSHYKRLHPAPRVVVVDGT